MYMLYYYSVYTLFRYFNLSTSLILIIMHSYINDYNVLSYKIIINCAPFPIDIFLG